MTRGSSNVSTSRAGWSRRAAELLLALSLLIGAGVFDGAGATVGPAAPAVQGWCILGICIPPPPPPTPVTPPPAPSTDATHPFPAAGWTLKTSTDPRDEWYEPHALKGSVYVIGDSITAGASARLHALHPTWQINGVIGRNVHTLPTMLQYRLTNGPHLSKVVLALGTNADAAWTEADFARVARMVPSSTKVIFVSTFRNPKSWPATMPYYERAAIQGPYSHWMNHVASGRAHTCVVPWRQWATKHPQMLSDGTHPTSPAKVVWAHLVSTTVTHCS
jgi:hypothetical protein